MAHNNTRRCAAFSKVSVVLLLIAVAGLSTLAKNSLYYQNVSSIRYVSIASKMKVAHAPITASQAPLRLIARIAAPKPPAVVIHRWDMPEDPPIQRISLTLSLQHRSPPLFIL